MVAVVNSVVVAACAGLALVAAAVQPVISVSVGAVIGVGTFALHERHHRRAFDAYSPEEVDRAAVFIPRAQPTEAG